VSRITVLLLVTSAVSYAQVNTNLDSSATGWQSCSTCAGGLNAATSITTTEMSSGRNGHGLKLYLAGPGDANALFYRSVGPTSANYFSYDVWVYVSSASLSAAQALEYDFYAYNAPYRFMWGSQCVMGGDWYGWNDNSKNWIDLDLPCAIAAGWTHIQWWGHRDPITTANCSGMPCSYQDVIGINDVYTTVNLVTPASWLSAEWANDSGAQVQLDQNASGADVYEGIGAAGRSRKGHKLRG
jgi:hypothetical protein